VTAAPITASQLLQELTGQPDLVEGLHEVLAWKRAHDLVATVRTKAAESRAQHARAEHEALILRGIDAGSLTPRLIDWAQGLSLHDLRAFIDCTAFETSNPGGN